MTRKKQISEASGYRILLVDDSSEYREATRFLLEHEGHTVLTAENGPDALSIIQSQKIDLLLLDYYMPGMTGEEVVLALRQFNQVLQIILQTGYASEQPPRELLQRLDIQGYYDKSEGPEKLLLWTNVGLKAAYNVQLLTKSRQGLRYILDVTPDMHKIQPLTNLLQGILLEVAGLLGVVNSFLAVLDEKGIHYADTDGKESFVALVDDDDTDLVIRASTGGFAGYLKVNNVFDQEKIRIINEMLKNGTVNLLPEITVVPLKVGQVTIGMIYLDRPVTLAQDQELLNVFANQAAVAIQNIKLYEMATTDQLTGLYVRSFFEKLLSRELRSAFRSQKTLSLLMVDLDKLKRINDLAGHLGGDQALAIAGDVLRQATRNTDILGRYGGDEFAILLPHTDREGAENVGQRIVSLFKGKTISSSVGELVLQASLGLSILEPNRFTLEDTPHPVPLEYFENAGHLLIKNADEALYASKNAGGGQMHTSPPAQWPLFTS